MPPQDTKWHKVSLSGKDTKWHNGTKWHNVCHLVSFCHVGNHGNSKNSIKAFFMLIKMVVKESGFWKNIPDNCGFHGNKIIESA